MRVVEIFNSIDGEGIRAGKLATFIRLAGCNLRCSYCDTAYAQELSQGQNLSIAEICSQVKAHGYKNITLTGGEPLLHEGVYDLVCELNKQGHQVNIETNGSIDIEPYTQLPDTIVTMDYKCPSSGCEQQMNVENLELLGVHDVLKFVVAETDFVAVRKILKRYKILAQVFLSPVFGKVKPSQLVEFLKRLNEERLADNVRVQLQMHKYIWNPQERGV